MQIAVPIDFRSEKLQQRDFNMKPHNDQLIQVCVFVTLLLNRGPKVAVGFPRVHFKRMCCYISVRVNKASRPFSPFGAMSLCENSNGKRQSARSHPTWTLSFICTVLYSKKIRSKLPHIYLYKCKNQTRLDISNWI